MKSWMGILLCLLACSCDRVGVQESSGKLGGLTLRFSERRAVSIPESLRIQVALNGVVAADLSKPLSSFEAIDLEVPFGSRLSIRANLFAAGDTLETGDTSFAMPSVAAVRVVLSLRSTAASGLNWTTEPRAVAHVNRSYSDTLGISGAGMGSSTLALIQGVPGLSLSGNRLEGAPTDTGTFRLKLSVARWSRIDTLEWSIGVVGAPVWNTAPRSTASAKIAFSDTLRLSRAGVDSAILSLVQPPAGMTLSGNALSWMPTDTGAFPVKMAVSRGAWIDTLQWAIAVVAGPVWETPPRSLAYASYAFSDTLRISGAGMDSAILSLVQPPAGMSLSEKALSWTPTNTGKFPLKVSVVRGAWIDTLSWSIEVRDSVEVSHGMLRIPAAGKSFVFGGGIGLDSGIVPTLVSLSRDFDMDPTEVTQDQFDSVMLANYPGRYSKSPWSPPTGTSGDLPASRVDFAGAVLYCNALSRAAGLDTAFLYEQLTWSGGVPVVWHAKVRRNVRGFRLPTEAEWDFAARGGSDSLHPWKAVSGEVASTFANYPNMNAAVGVLPVASLKPNGYGLFDMFGNVGELVLGVLVSGWFEPEPLDPWGPGIWDWGDFWKQPIRGGSSSSQVERTSTGNSGFTGFGSPAGFRTVLPVGTGGQGSIRPGLVPTSTPKSDSVFSVAAGANLVVSFTAWDLMGESLTLSVSEGGPVVVGDSIEWTPTRADIGLHRFEAIAVAGQSGRTSLPFPLKIQVK